MARYNEDITRQQALRDIDYSLEHPRVYHTPDEVALARRNVAGTDWGRRILDRVLRRAESVPTGLDVSFLQMTDAEIIRLSPVTAPDGHTYYAFGHHKFESVGNGNVCPIDGTPLDLVGLDNPGKVCCAEGHVFPSAEFPDDGSGWSASGMPADWAAAAAGESARFWFVASYNAYMANHMVRSLLPLAHAHALTGETRYARTAAVLLDVLASVFHTSYGPIVDYPNLSKGRLNRPAYQVGWALRDFTNVADLIWPSGELDVPSPTVPGKTIAQNVAENMMVEAADFIWHNMAQYKQIFHNGTAGYIGGLLAVSSLLGLEVGYVEFAFEGPVSLRNFLTNTVFRDGQYFETSTMYNMDFADWCELAYHLSNSRFPDGINLYDDPQYINLNIDGTARFDLAGRRPRYGDSASPDLKVTSGPVHGDFRLALLCYARTADPNRRGAYAQLLARIAGGDPNEHLGDDLWQAFNIDGRIEGFDLDRLSVPNRESELLPGKGFVMFRPEAGHDRGAMIRYGPTLSHGHADEMGLHIYTAGRDLGHDPGHTPKRHFQNSFMRQTVTHNTVVANECSQMDPSDDGGGVNFFSSRPGYTVVDLSNPNAYGNEGVDTYRRTTAYIDSSPDASYLVDIFRVSGARTSDYAFHGLGTHFQTDLALSPPGPGSVASPEYCWGNRLRPSGEISGFEREPHGFNAVPGNGYGFLGSPQRVRGDAIWSATWTVDEQFGPPARMRLTMLPREGREVIVADGPSLLTANLGMDPDMHTIKYVLARDPGPAPTQYVSVIDPVSRRFQVDDISSLEVDLSGTPPTAFEPIAFRARLADGETQDYFLSTLGEGTFTAAMPDGGSISTDAEFAMVRVKSGRTECLRLEKGTYLSACIGDSRLTIASPAAELSGTISEVDTQAPALLVDSDLPQGARLSGRYVLVDAPEYSRNTACRVDTVGNESGMTRIELAEATLEIASGEIESVDGNVIRSRARLPMTSTQNYCARGQVGNRYLDGRRLVDPATGRETRIQSVDGTYRGVTVSDPAGFAPGDRFVVFELKAGDRLSVPLSAEAVRSDAGFDLHGPECVSLKVELK